MSNKFKLEFGTGGLRAIMGDDETQMNEKNIQLASQGVANWVKIKANELNISPSIAISYDSRLNSKEFAYAASKVFVSNGIETWIYSELMPTPCLSFAVRELNCCAGIMVTASHNPKQYNGYKVYGHDGCQITNNDADTISREIENSCDSFVLSETSDKAKIIPDTVYDKFIENVLNLRITGAHENVSIVYSPLNGAGLKPVCRILKEAGFTDVFVVPEQETPDGNFPTIPKPNPEERAAMEIGLKYATERNSDLLIATDPDCDRVGIAVNGQLLSGNQVGCLLLDYICSNIVLPKNPVFIKTIVTTTMAEKIAQKYAVKTINTLTGFKYIGEQIGLLDYPDDFILGFEESYGYLSGSHARDKDAVNGALLICEMVAFYKSQGITLLDKLNELYAEFGRYENILEVQEIDDISKMNELIEQYRKTPGCIDYSKGIDGLPKSNVIKVITNNGWEIIRPSGTEPKLKIYKEIHS